MSWSFSLTQTDKTNLKEAVRRQQHCPPKLVEMLCEQIDAQYVRDGFAILVESKGHHDPNGCTGDFRVTLTSLV